MNCHDVKENLIELLGEGPAAPALAAHVKECPACAQELESLRGTMALMDAWEAPEPSPYFLTRLQAHIREERAKPQRWFAWLSRPAMAVSLAAVLIVGGVSIPLLRYAIRSGPPATGSAVSDLDSLGKNHDLLVSTDLLDELSGGPSDDVSDSEI
ncbi:MAG TPA: hypothetical protein VNW97_18870 [Candidatus Saccharimonadales bacterium]|jgi:hypothetical protein|nr:hypothetical protein [Candidatus Saccharimonadales bacterium]